MRKYCKFLLIKLWVLFICGFGIGTPVFLIASLNVERPVLAFCGSILAAMFMIGIIIHDESDSAKRWLQLLVMRYRHFELID